VAHADVPAMAAGQLTGFLIATLNLAPPVYDPGGLTCDIDDFVVTPAPKWPTTRRPAATRFKN